GAQTKYTYDADRSLTRITLPDGQTVELGYDTAGRLATRTLPTGQTRYGYDPTSDRVTSVTAPDGGALAYSYDGGLLTGATWSGPVAGAVTRTYDADLRLSALGVNGQTTAYQYDNDGLLTRAGDLTLSRSAQTGLVTGTTLGGTSDTRTYNGVGEPASYRATAGGRTVYDAQYMRDKLGRIVQQTETISATTATYSYS